MPAGLNFVLKYVSLTFIHLPQSDTLLQRGDLFRSFDDIITPFDCIILAYIFPPCKPGMHSIQGTGLHGGLNYVQRCLTFVDPQYEACIFNAFGAIKFRDGCQVFGKICATLFLKFLKEVKYKPKRKSFLNQSTAYPKEFKVKCVNYQNEVLKMCTEIFLFLNSITYSMEQSPT